MPTILESDTWKIIHTSFLLLPTVVDLSPCFVPKHLLLPSSPPTPVFILFSANSQNALAPTLPAPGSLSPLYRIDPGLDLLFHSLWKSCYHGSSDWTRALFLLVLNQSGANGCCFIIAFPGLVLIFYKGFVLSAPPLLPTSTLTVGDSLPLSLKGRRKWCWAVQPCLSPLLRDFLF